MRSYYSKNLDASSECASSADEILDFVRLFIHKGSFAPHTVLCLHQFSVSAELVF